MHVSSEEEGEARKMYKTFDTKKEFHCHDGDDPSHQKDRKDSSRLAKRKLFVACVLVLMFICFEVSYNLPLSDNQLLRFYRLIQLQMYQ